MKLNRAIGVAVVLSGSFFPAYGHSGHALQWGFHEGLNHPFAGIDHLLVMVGVGMWASAVGGSARLLLPSVFLAAMALGAFWAFAGLGFYNPELAVSVSVFAVGLVLLRVSSKSRLRSQATRSASAKYGWALAAALFAFSHGFVHALEAGAGSDTTFYAGGFLLSTTALLALGLILGSLSVRRVRWAGAAFGAFCTGVGLSLLLGV